VQIHFVAVEVCVVPGRKAGGIMKKLKEKDYGHTRTFERTDIVRKEKVEDTRGRTHDWFQMRNKMYYHGIKAKKKIT